MSLHIYCPHLNAIVLVGIQDERGLFYFFSKDVQLPGYHFTVKPRQPINEQILEQFNLQFETNIDGQVFEINQDYHEVLNLESGEEASFYLATLKTKPESLAFPDQTLPELLRAMPKSRARLPYMKTLQVLGGAYTHNTKAVDLEDVAKYLK